MSKASRAIALLSFLLACVSHAFLVPRASTTLPRTPSSSAIFSASESPRRRRRKRVVSADVPSQAEEDEEEEEEEESPQPRQDAPVAFAVTDVRNLVGGRTATPSQTSSTSNASERASGGSTSQPTGRSSSETPSLSKNSMATSTSSSDEDSLQQLLRDAQAMRGDDGAVSSSAESDGPSIPKIISSVLSTIVTVDFFVVLGFLLWFLAGVFSSYVLKNDDVQIAFNSNFETLVQPALGILMIAAIAGNFFNEEEEEA